MKVSPTKKMSSPLVSVIVLTFSGREKELFTCLVSIKNSSYGNIEILLVGNDCDLAFKNKILSRFGNIKTIWLPANTGCFGFNVGYANAKGKYILSLDDDTSIRPETIETIVDVFEKKPKNISILSLNAYNPQTKHYYGSPTAEFSGFQAGSAVFKKELFDKLGYYDKDFFLWGEEDDFTLKALNTGHKIDFEKSIIINHYEKIGKLRKRQIFLNARNKAWLNIKHFSLVFIPLLILRDLIWIALLPYRRKSIKALYYGLKGYLFGYLNFWVPLKKRKVVSYETQKKFIKHYLLSDLKNKWSKKIHRP